MRDSAGRQRAVVGNVAEKSRFPVGRPWAAFRVRRHSAPNAAVHIALSGSDQPGVSETAICRRPSIFRHARRLDDVGYCGHREVDGIQGACRRQRIGRWSVGELGDVTQ